MWMVLVWKFTDDLPNSPTFPPAKVSLYMVFHVLFHVTIYGKTFTIYTQLQIFSYELWICQLAIYGRLQYQHALQNFSSD